MSDFLGVKLACNQYVVFSDPTSASLRLGRIAEITDTQVHIEPIFGTPLYKQPEDLCVVDHMLASQKAVLEIMKS